MNIAILDSSTLGEDLDLSSFFSLGEVTIYKTTTKEQTFDRLQNIDVVITNKVIFDKDLLEKLTRLKLICLTATGMNNIDLVCAKNRGIIVKNVAGYSTKSVAQTTFMLVLALAGRLGYYDKYVKSKCWTNSNIFTNLDRPFFEISGKKWGIVGLGAIGKEVAKIATTFGSEVIYYSTSGVKRDEKYKNVTLEELFLTCDIVTIHAPLNEKTKNLVDKKELDLMKKDAILVNVGRGGIINEKALADSIKEEKIFAGCDVLEVEPMQKSSPFLNIINKDRYIITPHVAWGSVEAREKLIKLVFENVKEFQERGV